GGSTKAYWLVLDCYRFRSECIAHSQGVSRVAPEDREAGRYWDRGTPSVSCFQVCRSLHFHRSPASRCDNSIVRRDLSLATSTFRCRHSENRWQSHPRCQ